MYLNRNIIMTLTLQHSKSNKLIKSFIHWQAFDDEWHMYTMTYNGSYVSVYSDNVFVDGDARTGKTNSINMNGTIVHRKLYTA